MSWKLLSGWIIVSTAVVAGAQTQTPGAVAPPPVPGQVTVTGCIGGDGSVTSPYMLSNIAMETRTPPGAEASTTDTSAVAATAVIVRGYRLTGKTDLKPYVGDRVQVVGMLMPGAVAHTAPTAPSTGAPGTPGLSALEFEVVSVKRVEGTCAHQ